MPASTVRVMLPFAALLTFGLAALVSTASAETEQLPLHELVPSRAESSAWSVTLPGDGTPTTFGLTRQRVVKDDASIAIRSTTPVVAPAGAALNARVALWSGRSADGAWSAFVARSTIGAIGFVEPTRANGRADARRFVLVGADAEAVGLAEGPWHLAPEGPAAALPVERFCAAIDEAASNDGGIAGFGPALRRDFNLALDCDNEFRAIFPNNDAALDYLTALYGAIDAIYERDAGFSLHLGFIRIWDTEPDPFTDADPLYQFRDYWVKNQTETSRDLAELVTGRRDLPYGGVAWLSVACNANNGYSVVGYMNGRFASATATNPGNWDIVVAAHELGHNFGTHHTHAYDLDSCDTGEIRRGTIMSYCHVVSGASANIDNAFHAVCSDYMRNTSLLGGCGLLDCNSNGIDDAEEIGAGIAIDADANGTIDSCEDCNGDGILNAAEIAAGAADADANGIPDSCQADCDGDGTPDWTQCLLDPTIDLNGDGRPDSCDDDCDSNGETDQRQIILNPADDLDRDGRVDACQDCDGDGTTDGAALGNALGLWTVDGSGNAYELDARSGVRHRAVATGLAQATAILGLSDGSMLVGGTTAIGTNTVRRLTRPSGSHAPFLPGTVALSSAPVKLRFNDIGHLAIICTDRVVLVDPATGALHLTSQTVAAGGALRSIAKHPHLDNLSVHLLQADSMSLLQPDGSVSPQFALAEGFRDATDLAFLDNGDILVASREADAIARYSLDGTFLGRWDVGPNNGSSIALTDPVTLLHAPIYDGVLLTASTGSNATVAGYRQTDGYMERTHRVYRIDASAAIDMTSAAPSALDTNRNLIPDACESATPGDLNGDGSVTGQDLAIMLGAWGTAGADLDGDGTTSGADLAVLLGNWS